MSKERRWHWLSGQIDQWGFTNMVEIGVLKGENASKILKEHPSLEYTGVDPFKDPRSCLKTALQAIEPYGEAAILTDYSSEVAKGWKTPIDLVFIDGDHSYDGVCADINGWFPLVRPGGIICGHDYSKHHGGVRMAVDKYFPDVNVWESDNVWWVQVYA